MTASAITTAVMLPNGRTWVGEIAWLPWTLVSLPIALAWWTFLVVAALPVTIFVSFTRFQGFIIQPATSWPIWLTGSPLRVIRDDDFDPKRVSVHIQNHVSVLDGPIACGAIRTPLCGLENAAHLKVPGYGWLMRLANAIPVYPGRPNMFEEVSKAFKNRAKRGISILAFPEGHRTVDGKLRRFKRGAFLMARDAGLPIVPLAVRGAFDMHPKGGYSTRPAAIEVYMAPQIETAGLSDEQVMEVMDRVRAVIEAWVERRERLGHLCTAPLTTPSEADSERATG